MTYVGIDVSAAMLDVALHESTTSQFANTPTGIAALVAAGVPTAVCNPRQVRDFARSMGHLAIIRRYPSESARVEECTQPVAGSARFTGNGVELRITEPEVIEQLLRARPLDYWKIVHLPGGRFAVERVAIQY